MKRVFVLLTVMILGLAADAQTTRYQSISTPYRYRHIWIDSTLRIPSGSVPTLREYGFEEIPGALFYCTIDSSLYTYAGGLLWKKVGGSGGGGESLWAF